VSGPQRVVDQSSVRGRRFGRVHRTLVVRCGGRPPGAGQQQEHQRPPRERAALGGGLAAHIVSGEFVQNVVMSYAAATRNGQRIAEGEGRRRTFVFARRGNRRPVVRGTRVRAHREPARESSSVVGVPTGVTFSVMCAPRGPRHLRGAGTDPAIGRSPGTTICRGGVSRPVRYLRFPAAGRRTFVRSLTGRDNVFPFTPIDVFYLFVYLFIYANVKREFQRRTEPVTDYFAILVIR